MLEVYLSAALTLSGILGALWLLSIITNRVSFIDSFWGASFVIVAFGVLPQSPTPLQVLATILIGLWGCRLAIYLLRRFLAHGEDPRYVKIIGSRTGPSRHFFSLWFVFGLQGLLILIISAPIISIMSNPDGQITSLSFVGIAIWTIGAIFEWGGDWQLSQFKADPNNTGKVLDTGLWALTRHPNYFGDACIWWGIWLIGHDLTTIFAPILMTFLLMKWSGVPLLEKSLKKSKPAYADYIARTSSFFPLPPRKP